MILQPFWSYYGSAWGKTHRGFYPAPRHETIVEPFAGAAGYSCHWPERRVILGDLDESVVTTWRYLLRVTPAELLALPDIPDHGDISALPVTEEARLLMGWWLGRSRARPATKVHDRDIKAHHKGRFWDHGVRARLARQVEHIRHWRVFHCDYRELPVSGSATWFVDPPYTGKAGRRYRCGSTPIDFAALAEWCRGRRGQTIVCEASQAGWLPFWHCGEIRAAVGFSNEAVCVLRDGVIDRPQIDLGLPA